MTSLPHSKQLVDTPLDGAGATAARQLLEVPFQRLHAASRASPPPSRSVRREWLSSLLAALKRHQAAVEAAIDEDFGGRSPRESRGAEIFTSVEGLRYALRHLDRWMAPRSRTMTLALRPASARVVPQPKGVVGIISPWNYPLYLAISPATQALAAGNRVLFKPSEYTPRTAQVLRTVVTDALPDDVAQVVTGGPDVGDAFSRLPFDHLVFTGSTHVGRLVMRAAAENLVPVTLELGGKSPAIVHHDFDLTRAARRIAFAKCYNAGQTCVAPDYVLAPRARLDALVDALRTAIRSMFPTVDGNPDYTSIITDRHLARLEALRDEAVAGGARAIEVKGEGEVVSRERRRLAPTLLVGVTDDMKVMQEEIFGPLLPIVPVDSLDEALAYVNARPRPLALYYFDDDRGRVQRVVEGTTSGGVAINEALFHLVADDLPFGGIGPSGMGAYHGPEGFDSFSHLKAVFHQPRLNGVHLFDPPYGGTIDRILKLLVR